MGKGQVVELGCGPAHVAAYLAQRGVDISGLDLSPQMVEAGPAALFPSIEFVVGDMLDAALRRRHRSAAWSPSTRSSISTTTSCATAFAEMARVLRPDGRPSRSRSTSATQRKSAACVRMGTLK